MPLDGNPQGIRRLPALDALRGLAMVWMVGFHACFDLSWLGFAHFDMLGSPWWWGQRVVIVSLFLFSSGLSQSLAARSGRSDRRWWMRWLQIAGSGLLVTVGSWLAFPASFIYFGILQAVSAMLLLHRWLFARLGTALLWLAPLAVLAPWFVHSTLFDPPLWNWTGLIAHKPITEDYVPLLPWIGVFWFGAGSGAWLAARDPACLHALPAPALLRWLGRRPLAVYLLQQPLLLGVLLPLAHWSHRL